jgi:hypothetical protein
MGLFISLALHKASFIALNSFSERYYQDKSKSYELLKYGVGLALLVGIVGGVFSSKLFEFMKVAGLL